MTAAPKNLFAAATGSRPHIDSFALSFEFGLELLGPDAGLHAPVSSIRQIIGAVKASRFIPLRRRAGSFGSVQRARKIHCTRIDSQQATKGRHKSAVSRRQLGCEYGAGDAQCEREPSEI